MRPSSSQFDALVVESDPLAAELLQRGLEDLGFAVTVATDWLAVWEQVQRKVPRLVVAPLASESGAPPAGIRKLRTLDAGRRAIVLATHPRHGRPDRQALQDIGIDDVLAYPIEPDELDLRLAIARSRVVERQSADNPLAAQGGIHDAMARSDEATVIAAFDAAARAFRVVSVNPAFERLTGYNGAAVTGRTHRVLVESKDSEALLQCLRESAEQNRAGSIQVRGLRQDGRSFPVEWSITPVPAAEAQPHTLLCILRPAGPGPDWSQQIRAAEEKFRNIVDVSLQGVLVHRDWNLKFVNRTLADLLGYPDAEAVLAKGRLEELIAPEHHARLKNYNEARKRGHAPEHYELEMVKRDGSRIQLQGFVRQVSWEGEPAVLASYVDVTEHRNAQAELQSSRALLQAMFDAMPQSVYVKDPQGAYVTINRAFAEMWQRPAEAIIGRRFASVEAPPSEQAEVIERTDQQVLKEGQRSDSIIARTIPHVGLRKFRTIKVPLRGADGGITGLVGISEDVTERMKAEDELRESRALLQAVFDTIPHDVFVKDRDRRFVVINTQMAKTWRRDPEKVAGLSVGQIGSDVPAETQMIEETDLRVLERGETVDEVITRTMLSGEMRQIRLTKRPLRDASGTVTGLVGLAEDITERIAAEEALRRSQSLLHAIFDTIPHGLFMKDREGRFLVVNQPLSSRWGLRPEDLIGQRVGGSALTTQEEVDAIITSDARVLSTGRTDEYTLSRTMVDGSKRQLRYVKAALRDADGEIAGIVGVAEDITDQLAAREALQRSQAVLQTVFDTIPHHLFLKDAEQRYVAVNRAFLNAWGGTAADYIGKLAVQAPGTPPTEMERVRSTDAALLSTGIAIDDVLTRTTPKGVQHHRVIKAPVRGVDGRVVGLVGIAEDISERKESERALQESEARYRSLTEESPYGILIHRNRAPIYVNPAFARMYGYDSAAEVLALESIDTWVAPEEVARVRGYADARLRADPSPPETYEFRGKKKDGTLIWVQNSVRPVIWEGQPALQASMLDVTERKNAEAELAASQRLLRTLIDTLPQSIHVKDSGGRYQVVNTAMANTHGVVVEDLLGKTIADISLRQDASGAQIQDIDSRTMREDRQLEIPEMQVSRPDGSRAWERLIKAPLHDEAGNVIGVVGIADDITAQKKAADELRNSRGLLQTVFDTLPQSLSLKDDNGRYVLVNQAFLRRNNVTAQQIYSRTPEVLPRTASEQAKVIHAADVEVITTGKVVELPEMRFGLSDGSYTWVRIIKAPFRDSSGRVSGIVSIAEDLTSRKEAEDKVRDSQRLLQTVINALPQSIYVKDLKGTYQLVNSAVIRRHSLSAPAIIDHTVDEISAANPAVAERIRKGDATVIQTGSIVEEAELLVSAPDRPEVWMRVIKTPLRNEQGNIVGIITIADDVTARKQAESQRLELERQILHTQKLESLGVLAGGIAHDFNNLLTGVLGNVELALMDTAAAHPAAPTLQQIKQASLRAAALTQQMLAYSGRGRLQIHPMDVSALVEEMAELLKVSISKKIAIQFDLVRDLPAVEGDPTQLQQIVMNLITNASEAIGDAHGAIHLATGKFLADRAYLASAYLADALPEGAYVYMEVSDTGTGMTEEVKARIFDPFFTTKFTGRGLGLAAVLGIVRSHHGTIHIKSEPGKGSTFRVLFPASAGGAAPLKSPQAAPQSTWRGSGTILVVDDEPIVRSVMQRQLASLGFTVVAVDGGRSAIAWFIHEQASVAAVLLDMTMPDMGGVETLRELKRIRPDVRIIVCSGYSEQDAAQQFKDAPPDGFLQKPTQFSDVTRKLQEILG